MTRAQKGFAWSNNAQFIVVKDHNISRVNLVTSDLFECSVTEPGYLDNGFLLHLKCQYTNYIFTVVDIIKGNIVIAY